MRRRDRGAEGRLPALSVHEGVLSDEEIVAALSWIKAQWPEDIRSRHDELNRSAGR